ncbi:TIGR01244 family sulfur transferase [Paracoccus aminophilus]|uniref:Beta-lactamase hydrolase-like protein phosphatase-like domain-containing protein n=1 Tax=Paracoccus aminophilus JCM 7686 TaxID=1367847 RepID=S5YTR7_PARAH|nr:TIGR01244 family sulfur transferase [Paracoccus aminophilus]AGT08601.1 hypothetical protein JCM7686_1500 [Paracoccus aminophilus JCM 7686]
MDLRQLTPDLAVSPQIDIEDVAVLAQAGFRVLINNRPDEEIGTDLDNEAMKAAAEAAGLEYHFIPFQPGTITPDMVSAYAAALAAEGPKAAYCRSGNRSTVLWALASARDLPLDEILATATKAGYDLSGVAPLIASLARG